MVGFGDALFELDASLRVVKRHTGVRRFSKHITSKLEARADATTAVLRAFGRAVIVRNAPGLGVTAIEPAASLSSSGRK